MTGNEERVVIRLNGGGPWGFRLQGGAGTGHPLTVSKVRRKSKAYRRLREGDRILSVNGRPCEGLTYDQLMDIADKSGTDLTLEVIRKECDKENLDPVPDPLTKDVDSKEILSINETSIKTIKEEEGFRIKSAAVVPEVFETPKPKDADVVRQPFPSFGELQAEKSFSSSSSTQDDHGFTKTTLETKHQVKGNTATSFVRKEQESVSRTPADPHGMPDITLDTIDLNKLISETQKRIDSFRGGSFTPEPEIARAEPSSQSLKRAEVPLASPAQEAATLPKGPRDLGQISEDRLVSKEDPAFSLPDLGSTGLPDSSSAFSLPDIGFTTSETSTEHEDTLFGTTTTTIMKKKKMFSSSSFYEEPQSIYPTMEEQVEMARKIADSLADDTNKKSKGANMFYKRVKRSSKWIHEGPEPSDESAPDTPEFQGAEPPTPDPSQVPFRPSKGSSKLKLVLDPRHPLDLTALRSSGHVVSEHNVVSPDMCHGLVKDLHSPVGKGAALFAKRKKKSEEWVVDEERVKAMLQEKRSALPNPVMPSFSPYPTIGRQEVKLVKTPWEAAMENPFGLCDAAFARVNPDQLADTVIKAADYKRATSLSRESSRMEGCLSPPPAQPDVYHAKAPKGWPGSPSSYTSPMPPLEPASGAAATLGKPQPPKRMVFHNFNTVPRLWKGASVR